MAAQAVTPAELYGHFVEGAGWREGCFAWVARGMSEGRAPRYGHHQTAQWLVLDGAIDPAWAETLNTCLDDAASSGRALTLASGERLPFTVAMQLVFEVDSVAHATPATLSRCGVLCLDALVVGFEPLIAGWLRRRGDDCDAEDGGASTAVLKDLFARHVPTALLALHTARASFLVGHGMLRAACRYFV